MADPKDAPKPESFLRKVVRFVSHPTTDWADLNTIQRESAEADFAKSELKAMIERKRRNDFVRKREFDMLRKIRREGVTGDRLAGLDNLSHLDDSEVRAADSGSRQDMGVKAKIDEIEQQMVGNATDPDRLRSRSDLPRRGATMRASGAMPLGSDSRFSATTAPQIMRAVPEESFHHTRPQPITEPVGLDGLSTHLPIITGPETLSTAGATLSGGQRLSALSPLQALAADPHAAAVEVTELAHDPDLDEAVIAFANADFEQCERMLTSLVSNGGARAQHPDTWAALFDLYRAIGQQPKFEALAVEYAQRFGWSAPQWFSMPKLVADAAAAGERQRPVARGHGGDTTIGWVAPPVVDLDAVAELRSQLLQLPLPWVLDWRAVRRVEAAACSALTQLLGEWSAEPIEMRWIGGDAFLELLGELAPNGVKDADPAVWLLRLEALRLANRPVDFDQVAIDYCLTYEVSPPSWTPARCTLRASSGGGLTVAPITQIADVSTTFLESQPADEQHTAHVELSGQLVGDIGELLRGLDGQIGAATMVHVSCARLIRVDFIAAGDLLNWVIAKRSENRAVKFVDAHRLVALFCGAMGISEHARVTVRTT
jgi:hypothetical protein